MKLDRMLVDWSAGMKPPLDFGPPRRSKLRIPEK
jgi:hypothetical protein